MEGGWFESVISDLTYRLVGIFYLYIRGMEAQNPSFSHAADAASSATDMSADGGGPAAGDTSTVAQSAGGNGVEGTLESPQDYASSGDEESAPLLLSGGGGKEERRRGTMASSTFNLVNTWVYLGHYTVMVQHLRAAISTTSDRSSSHHLLFKK